MLPSCFQPMLAQKAQKPFDCEEHLFEIKWDGIRCLSLIQTGGLRLQSRHGLEVTQQFPELGCLAQLPSGTVLDGELVVFHEGKPVLCEVQRRVLLQNRPRIQLLSRIKPVNYVVFDLLFLKGKSLMAAPLMKRRKALQELITRCQLPGVLVSEWVRGHGLQLFAHVVSLGLEGIMAKHLDGPYLPGKRSRYWLKIKPEEKHGESER